MQPHEHDAAIHRDLAGSVSEPTPLLAKVLTVSDSVVAGTREDASGQALIDRLTAAGFRVMEHRVSPDGAEEVANALAHMAYFFNGLIVSTGGTGFGPRVLDRRASGLSEAMRAVNPLGRLSRGIAGTRGRALILNVAGSPGAAVEMLDAVLDIVPHALRLMSGRPAAHPSTITPH